MSNHGVKLKRRDQRRKRVRGKIYGTMERPRLSVFRSLKHIYAQVIDDSSGKTLCQASTKSKSLSGQIKHGGNCEAAALVGRIVAEQARMQNVRKVTFDRGPYRYHGRIQALAEAARKVGLEF
ncbi:MAG: 50S ribosomal protein L18 [Phycisphaerae bacterium]